MKTAISIASVALVVTVAGCAVSTETLGEQHSLTVASPSKPDPNTKVLKVLSVDVHADAGADGGTDEEDPGNLKSLVHVGGSD